MMTTFDDIDLMYVVRNWKNGFHDMTKEQRLDLGIEWLQITGLMLSDKKRMDDARKLRENKKAILEGMDDRIKRKL